MTITPSRQRNAVSEGMALGLIMCDRITLPWFKVAIDLSFEGSWRSWQYRNRFSQVGTDIRRGSDGVRVMTRADERKHTANFDWDANGREIAIYARGIWAGEEVDVDEAAQWIDGDVPAQGWPPTSSGASRSEASPETRYCAIAEIRVGSVSPQ